MSRWLASAFLALVGLFGGVAASCGSTGGYGSLQCWGGAYLLNNGCFCPLGMTWDGGSCQGVAQAGSCTGGAFQVDTQCFCGTGTQWDGARCAEIVCTGGAYLAGNQCMCPDGKQWIDAQCQVPCVPGAYHVDVNTCACPAGLVSYGDQLGCQPSCSGGAQPNGQGGCVCPSGTVWFDNQGCMTPVAQPTPGPYPQPEPWHPTPGPGRGPGPGPGPEPGHGHGNGHGTTPTPTPTPVYERWEMPKYPSPPFIAHYGGRCREFLNTPNNKQECMTFCTQTIQTGVSQGCTCMDMVQHCDGHKDKPVRVQ